VSGNDTVTGIRNGGQRSGNCS